MTSPGYIIRDYEKGDERLITALFQEVFGKTLTTAQWEWKYAVPGLREREDAKAIIEATRQAFDAARAYLQGRKPGEG